LDDLRFDLERRAVRVVLQDQAGRVLLFHAVTPSRSPAGWWELPGGGIDPGETYLEAAVREIGEETGLLISAGQVSQPRWNRSATWQARGIRRLQHEVVVHVTLAADRPAISDAGQTPEELEDYAGSRWWELRDLLTSAERFYPGRLPELLPAFLAGELIDEPFERWN
jgi:8-oxo-dGTP pyrophosphatase MutT (NUDIX family)